MRAEGPTQPDPLIFGLHELKAHPKTQEQLIGESNQVNLTRTALVTRGMSFRVVLLLCTVGALHMHNSQQV